MLVHLQYILTMFHYYNLSHHHNHKNHVYESEELKSLPMYTNIFNRVIELHNNEKLIKEVTNSFSVVEYLMIMMNNRSAKVLKEHGTGVFRSLCLGNVSVTDVDPGIQNFVNAWKNAKSEYTINADVGHDMLMLSDYAHITSPIRRLVDILQQKNYL